MPNSLDLIYETVLNATEPLEGDEVKIVEGETIDFVYNPSDELSLYISLRDDRAGHSLYIQFNPSGERFQGCIVTDQKENNIIWVDEQNLVAMATYVASYLKDKKTT